MHIVPKKISTDYAARDSVLCGDNDSSALDVLVRAALNFREIRGRPVPSATTCKLAILRIRELPATSGHVQIQHMAAIVPQQFAGLRFRCLLLRTVQGSSEGPLLAVRFPHGLLEEKRQRRTTLACFEYSILRLDEWLSG